MLDTVIGVIILLDSIYFLDQTGLTSLNDRILKRPTWMDTAGMHLHPILGSTYYHVWCCVCKGNTDILFDVGYFNV